MIYFQNSRKIKKILFGISVVISVVFINYIMENMEYIRGYSSLERAANHYGVTYDELKVIQGRTSAIILFGKDGSVETKYFKKNKGKWKLSDYLELELVQSEKSDEITDMSEIETEEDLYNFTHCIKGWLIYDKTSDELYVEIYDTKSDCKNVKHIQDSAGTNFETYFADIERQGIDAKARAYCGYISETGKEYKLEFDGEIFVEKN